MKRPRHRSRQHGVQGVGDRPRRHVLGSGLLSMPTTFGAGGLAEQDPEVMWTLDVDGLPPGARRGRPGPCRGDRRRVRDEPVVVDRGRRRRVARCRRCTCGSTSAASRSSRRSTAGDDGEASGLAGPRSTASPRARRCPHLVVPAQPEIHRQTVAYLEPMDYLNARFTGRIAATANSAMPLALTDNRQLGPPHGRRSWPNAPGSTSPASGADRSLSVLATDPPDVADDLGLRRDVRGGHRRQRQHRRRLRLRRPRAGPGDDHDGHDRCAVVHHPVRYVDTERFIVTMPSALEDRYYVVAEGGIGGKFLEAALTEAVGEATRRGRRRSSRSASAAGLVAARVRRRDVPAVGVRRLAPAPDPRHRGAFLGISLTTGATISRGRCSRASRCRCAGWPTRSSRRSANRSTICASSAAGPCPIVWSQIMADVVGRPIEQLRTRVTPTPAAPV